MLLDRLGLEVLLESLVVKVTLLLDARGVLQLEVALPAFRGFALALHLVLHPGQLFAPVVDPSLEKLFRAAHTHTHTHHQHAISVEAQAPQVRIGLHSPRSDHAGRTARLRGSGGGLRARRDEIPRLAVFRRRPTSRRGCECTSSIPARAVKDKKSVSDLGTKRKKRRAATALPGSTASGR